MSLTSVPANAAGSVGSSCLIIWLSLQKIMPREKQTDIFFFFFNNGDRLSVLDDDESLEMDGGDGSPAM